MKRTNVVIAALILGLLLTKMPVAAMEGMESKDNGHMNMQHSKFADDTVKVLKQITVTGIVESVDAKNMKLSFKDKQGISRECTMMQNCQIRKGRNFVDLSAVRSGDQITMICKESKGKLETDCLTIKPQK